MFTSVSAPREETKPHIALAVAAARVSTILFRLTTLPQNRKAPSSNVVPMPVASHHSCLRLSTRRRPFDAAVSRSPPPAFSHMATSDGRAVALARSEANLA